MVSPRNNKRKVKIKHDYYYEERYKIEDLHSSGISSSESIASLYHSFKRPHLLLLLGHVRRLSQDQVGCRLLQQSLDEDGPQAATAILREGLQIYMARGAFRRWWS